MHGSAGIATCSSLPGTTIGQTSVSISGSMVVDTPGLRDDKGFVKWMSHERVRPLIPKKALRPRGVHGFKPGDALEIGDGICRIEYLKGQHECSVAFYGSGMLQVRNNSERSVDPHIPEFMHKDEVLSDGWDVCLRGIGWISLFASKRQRFDRGLFRVSTPGGLGVFCRKSLVGTRWDRKRKKFVIGD